MRRNLKVMKKRFQLFICVQVLFKHILIPVSFGTVLAPRAHPHPVAYAAWWRSCLSSATSLRERTNIHHHHHQSTSVFAVSRCVYLEDAGGIVDGRRRRRRRDTVDFNSLFLWLLLRRYLAAPREAGRSLKE